MIGVEPSVVRYLVGTLAAQARRAAALIDDDDTEIGVSLVALARCAHVLRTQDDVPAPYVIETLITSAWSLPGRPIPDALIVAASIDANAMPFATFDRTQRGNGIAIREP